MKIYKLKKYEIDFDLIKFENFLEQIKDNDQNFSQSLSPIWRKVLFNYKLQNDVTKLEINELIDKYSSYFQNGLSDGACAGLRMQNLLYYIKYLFRELYRARVVKKLINEKCYEDISLEKLPLCRNAFTGEIWMLKIHDLDIPVEICDHLFFLIKIYDDLKSLSAEGKTFIFIGDGSGFLSNLILNIFPVKKAIFVDLPQFLIRQYIVNNKFIEKIKFYTPPQFNKIDLGNYIIINQDSFPEIPKQDFINYVSNTSVKYVSKIFSYNQKPLDKYHINWSKILLDNSWNLVSHQISKTRKKYFIEIYSRS
jgi:hypothetical protein